MVPFFHKALQNNDKIDKENINITFDSKMEYKLFEYYEVKGRLENFLDPTNYKGFNFKIYNYSKDIFFKMVSFDSNFKKKEYKESLYTKITRKINKFIHNKRMYLENINDKNIALIKGIVIGDTDDINDITTENIKNLNIYHIISVSGFHLYILTWILKSFFEKIHIKGIFLDIILIIFLSFFAIVVNASSAYRACIGVILISFYKNLHLKKSYIQILLETVFLIILFNPLKIFDIGLILSFLGTCGIILFSNITKKSILDKKDVIKNYGKEEPKKQEKENKFYKENTKEEKNNKFKNGKENEYYRNYITINFYLSNNLSYYNDKL